MTTPPEPIAETFVRIRPDLSEFDAAAASLRDLMREVADALDRWLTTHAEQELERLTR